nr:hypothetical protein [Tanacetum cinerariifolium]
MRHAVRNPKLEILKKEKEGVDGKLASFLTALKDLDNLIESQRSDKNKDGLGYSAVPPPPAQIYSSPKKDMSWTGLPEFADDTITNYRRPLLTIESTSGDDQNKNPSVTKTEASPNTISPKPFIKFVKVAERSTTNKVETVKKPSVKYAELYRKTTKRSTVRGNQRNWNNLKSQQLCENFVRKNRACFNCGHFDHLSYDCGLGQLRDKIGRLNEDKKKQRCSIKFRGRLLGIKCSKIFPLSVMNSHSQKKFPLLEEVPTARVILPLIKRYIDTKPNHELIHYCLTNPPYKLAWADKEVPISEGIDNDIYSTVDACPNACEMWKAIERHVERECQKPKRVKDAAYHREKMLLCKQEEAGIQLNAEQTDWRDDTDDGELEDQELEAYYKYMEQIQEVSPDAADSGPIFNAEPLKKVSNDDHYNVFAMESEHPEEEIDQNDDDNDLANEQKELDKVIALENKVKVLDNIVYKTGQSVQTMNILNNKCRTSFAKPVFLKKAQRANPHLYDIGCYNDNLALMLTPEFDEVIRLEKESRSNLCDLIRPFDYDKLNNLYDLFVPQREKSSEQRYFSKRSILSHTSVNNGNSKESFNKQTILLEKRMDESIPWDKKCKISIELFKIKTYVDTIFDGMERCKETIAHRTYSDSLRSQLESQKTQFLNEIDQLSREYYYADHINAILGVYTKLDEVTNLQCDYLELLEKCECLEKELSNSKMMSKSFEGLQKHAINLEIDLQQYLKAQLQDKGIVISELKKLIEKLKGKSVDTNLKNHRKDFSKSKSVTQNNVSNDFSKPVTAQTLPPNKKSILKNMNVLAPGMYKLHTEPNQARTFQLTQDSRKTNKRVSFSTGVIPTTSVSRPQLKSNRIKDRVLCNNHQGKKQDVEDHRRNVNFSKNKTFVTACNDSLKAKTLNVNFVCTTCGKCVLNEKHNMCVLKPVNGLYSRTKMPIVVPVRTKEPKSTVKQSVDKPLKKPVDSKSNQKPRNRTRKLYERVTRRDCPIHRRLWVLKAHDEKLKSSVTRQSHCNNLNAKTLNVNFVCATCGKCVLNDKHDMYVLNSVAKPLKKTVASESNQKPRNITMKLYECVSKACSWWYLMFTPSGYKWKPKSKKENVNPNVTMPLGNASRTANVLDPITSRCSTVSNTPLSSNSFAARTVKFGNDQIAPILSYEDLVQGAITIKRVYYVEGLNHNLFSIGSRGTDLYSITLQDKNSLNPIFLMAKATSSYAWLWHRHLSHLNFDTIKLLSKNDIVVGLSKLKFIKDHLCSSCELGKAKRKDGENLDKMKEKGNACIFVGYSTQSRAYRVFNKRTKVIVETIHVNFDELPQMASDHVSSDPGPECPTMALEHDSLSPRPQCQENVSQTDRTLTTSNELDFLFCLMLDELLNGSSKVVLKSSVVSTADAPNQRQ